MPLLGETPRGHRLRRRHHAGGQPHIAVAVVVPDSTLGVCMDHLGVEERTLGIAAGTPCGVEVQRSGVGSVGNQAA